MLKRMTMMMGRWTHIVFDGHLQKVTPKVRALRLLEEVIELSQAEGVTEQEIDTIKRQVMDKPAGSARAEFGGVMVTIMGYAWSTNYNAEEAFWEEFARIMHPDMMKKVRDRNLLGDKIGMQ